MSSVIMGHDLEQWDIPDTLFVWMFYDLVKRIHS